MAKFPRLLGIVSLLLTSTFALAQFRTITVQNAPSNPVPANINANGTPTVNVGNMPAVSGSVTINNTGGNPVPVAGSVNATVTGNVGITGTPVVNPQSPNAPATVINGQTITPVVVRDMDEGARHRFQHRFPATLCPVPSLVTIPSLYLLERNWSSSTLLWNPVKGEGV